ncbi:MAG: polysaccharide biosynthesis tyrosine autokinase [Actinomycetales bacterium]|nr:polysaccharide biosynthesis tyrosine autokinase [Actinomycetales bacterium]
MELRDIITMLRAHWVGIAVLAVLGALVAGAASLSSVPEYRTFNTVLVAVQAGETISDLNQGSSFVSREVKTYAEVARSPIVLEPVVQKLGLRTSARGLRGDVTTTVKGETKLIDITVTRPDAREAAAIADAVAAELATAVELLSPDRVDGSPSVLVSSIAPAAVPREPFSPNIPRDVALGTVLGLVLGLGWAALRTTLDTKVRAEPDVRAITDAPVLGLVSYDSGATGKAPHYVPERLSVRAEEYRQIRTNLQFVDAASRPRSIVVTSSRGGEGKSVTALNLAMALADTGVSVCLVDADLRRPSVADYLGLEGAAGLTTVLIRRAVLDDVLQPVGSGGLDVLTSGRTPPNPSELLGSRAMADVVAELESRYDVVLLDCAPLLPVTDATILSKTADGILLVAGGGIVTKDELTEATGKLATVGATVLGVVLNRVERKSGSRTYGYHPHSVDLEPESVPPRRPGHRESERETEALPRDTEGDGTEDGRPAPSAARSPAPGRPAPAAPRPSRHRKRHRPRALREAVRRTADGTGLDRFVPDEA